MSCRSNSLVCILKFKASWQRFVDFPRLLTAPTIHRSRRRLPCSLSCQCILVLFARSEKRHCGLRHLWHLPTSRRALQKRLTSLREISNCSSSRVTRIMPHLGSLKLVSSKVREPVPMRQEVRCSHLALFYCIQVKRGKRRLCASIKHGRTWCLGGCCGHAYLARSRLNCKLSCAGTFG